MSQSNAPFQFTIRQVLLLTAACGVILTITSRWGAVGFAMILLTGCAGTAIWVTVWHPRPWGDIGIILLACGLVAAVLIRVISDAPPVSRRANCTHNLFNIALALSQYQNDFGCYPPPYVADADGEPMHSWRVLILPYLDHKAIYKEYRFDEPWDGPNNRKLHSLGLKIFQCPAHPDKQPSTETDYVAVVGPNTVWPGGSAGSIRATDIADGLSNTILVVEVADSGIHWMEPRDLHVNQMPPAINGRGQGVSSHHKGGANVAFADGSIRFLKNDIPLATVRAILTRNGKEPVTGLP